MLRTLRNLETSAVGFDRDHLLLFTVRPGLNGYKEDRLIEYYSKLREHIQSIPGVQHASFASRSPLAGGTGRSGGVIDGITPDDRPVEFFRHQVGPDYFQALGVPVVLGRGIDKRDRVNDEKVVVVNEKLVATYFHGENPIGHYIKFGSNEKPMDFQIVGVVKDVKYGQVRNEAPPTLYFSYMQFLAIPNQMTFEVRTAGDPATIVESVRRECLAIDRNVPVVDVKSQAEAIDQTVYIERTLAALTSTFGVLALLLACVGLYGTMSYAIGRRTREIGIRMALGARRTDILFSIVLETAIVVAAGLLVGFPLTFAGTRLLKEQLFGLTPHDPMTTAAALISISAVTIFAGYLPARRAARVAPIVALRTE